MSKVKLSNKEKVLKKNPDLFVDKNEETVRILWKTKTGIHTLGVGKDEDGAWNSCAAFYGVK
jgi:hypothetical protein